jgi:hypothetical protein
MTNKTITLTEPYPSDFKPTISMVEIHQYFDAHGFHDARMIGGSKVQYSQVHPEDLVVFNANIIMSGYGKIWYGDLNLTLDWIALKSIAQSLNTILYILWESDGRFGEENKPIDELIKKSVWNTTDDKPTLEWYKKKMKKKYNGEK